MTAQPTTSKTAASKVDNSAEQAKKTKALAEARSAAVSALVENRRSEFNELMIAEAKKRGYDWKPKPTEVEKRRAALKALLEEDPSLIEEVRNLTGLNATDETPSA